MSTRAAGPRPWIAARAARVTAVVWMAVLVFAGGAAASTQDSLAAIADSVRESRRLQIVEGVPDYSPTAIAQRRARLAAARERLDALAADLPSRDRQIEYLLVHSLLSAEDFELRVTRPWQRDPGLAVDLIRRIPYAEVPADAEQAEQLSRRLRSVSAILDAARAQLTRPAAQLARMAIRQLSRSDGVNQGEPRRTPPPEGVLGWFDDLVDRLVAADHPLATEARAARARVSAFHDWLDSSADAMTERAWIGLENYDWYLRNVLLMPYDAEDLRVLARRELARARTFLQIERHRNRGLPEIEPARTAEEHEARVRDAEELVRAFIAANELMTIPGDIPPQFETDAFWIVRADGTRHFWEEITYRDPLNNHIHASIPGHRFDGLIGRRETRPIRAGFRDGVRAEGWAFYIEEMFLQAGLLDERPRAKELFYIAQLKRAARVPAELAMQVGAFDLQDAIEYLVEQVPLMEPDLARYDLAIYLRRPTYGMNYVMGKVMMEELLSDRALQLGDRFDLGVFHDEFLAAGPIPLSLIRWEMTGLDDDIASLGILPR